MYAILRQGGRQYRVSPGDVVQVELIHQEPGTELTLSDVLMLRHGNDLHMGDNALRGVAVRAKVVRQGRSPKIRIYKFKRRKGFSRQMGHRQDFTELRVTAICRDDQDLSE